MTVKELIEMLKTCNVKVGTKTTNTTLTCLTGFEVHGLYVILKASSNRAGFI